MSDCCKPGNDPGEKKDSAGDDARAMHLVIIGGGSAAFSAAIKASELGARATIINDGLPIGGTCVNVGCVPSKALIRAAQAHHNALHHDFRGITSTSRIDDFAALVAQKDSLVEELRRSKYVDVAESFGSITIVEGRARLVGPREVRVGDRSIEAERILIATGASPRVPDVVGLADAGYLTSTEALSLEKLPRSAIVIGGRYIALELGQMLARLGTRVILLQRSARILPGEASDLTDALTGYLRGEGMEIVTGVTLCSITRSSGDVVVTADVGGKRRMFSAEEIVVATGRRPNTAGMGLEEVGVKTNESGAVEVDDTLQTKVPGIFAAGDVIGEYLYVYAAAYEGALAAQNAVTGAGKKRDYTAIPWVIFTDPQVAGVGMDLDEAKGKGLDAEETVLPLSHVPRALAGRDTRGFVKLIRDRSTDKLLGARILAPEGSELLMEAALAIKYSIPVAEIASTFHPYLTLSEAIKLAALTFSKDVSRLSCCAG